MFEYTLTANFEVCGRPYSAEIIRHTIPQFDVTAEGEKMLRPDKKSFVSFEAKTRHNGLIYVAWGRTKNEACKNLVLQIVT